MGKPRLHQYLGENTLAWFIILLVIAVAVAPLMHFMPSKRQRHEASLREAAALAGLFVEFRDLPLREDRLKRLRVAERQVLYYGKRLPSSRKNQRTRQAWLRQDADWQSQEGREAPPVVLAKMPDAVVAVGISEASCGVYWREVGDENTVHEIADLLKDWEAQIQSA